jgi:hypothetical protein
MKISALFITEVINVSSSLKKPNAKTVCTRIARDLHSKVKDIEQEIYPRFIYTHLDEKWVQDLLDTKIQAEKLVNG